MKDKPIIIYLNNTGQPLTDQIKIGTKPFEIPNGAIVSFKMRYANNANLKVDSGASIVDPVKGKVSYSWGDNDLNEVGEYSAWWEIIAGDKLVDSEEFSIIVAKHAPGYRTTTGAIYRIASSFLPSTWSALEASNNYGDALLQQKVEYVKMHILGYSLPVEDEVNLDIRVLDFLAKNVAAKVIPAGIDYWLDQKVSVTIEGAGAAQEIYDYEDRAESLMTLYQRMIKEIAKEEKDILNILDTPLTRSKNSVPSYAEGQDKGFVTPSPVLNFRPYNSSVYSDKWNKR
jgi:hypothetical protein